MEDKERKELHKQETLWHEHAMERMSELETRVTAQRKVVNILKNVVAECESRCEQACIRIDKASNAFVELKKRVIDMEEKYYEETRCAEDSVGDDGSGSDAVGVDLDS